MGLGQSRQKYSWIPEAHNDFIFAIIGEELGLVGTLVVLVLFAILGTAIYRVVVAQKDMFHRVLAGTIMVWLLGQATVNMAVVTGLAPVVGIPLPVHFLRRLGPAHVPVRHRRSLVPGPGQMAPGLQPKRLFRFGPAGLAASLRKRTPRPAAAAANTAQRGKPTGKPPPASAIHQDTACRQHRLPGTRRTGRTPAPRNPARKRK